MRSNNKNLGYRGRRLPDIVSTGIFECNSRCKCDCRCSNRVAQNGISVRLQLFKTPKKGWGLRCLDDIAKGAFICIYAGHLLTEEQSDQRGIDLGDEYFAELDFVQCMKKYTEYNNIPDSNGSNLDSSGSEDLDSNNKKKKLNDSNKLNTSLYQRPKSHAGIPKTKTSTDDAPEIEYIFLGNIMNFIFLVVIKLI